MRLNFAPKNQTFFQLFLKQAEVACQTAQAMHDLLLKFVDVESKVKRVSDLEHQGDELVHDVALLLNRTFVTPIDREDIHQLASTLDDIMDFIQGAATRFMLFKIKASSEPAVQMAQCLVESTQVILEAIRLLPEFKDVTDMRRRIKELERQGDQINRAAIADLFDDTRPVLEVIKWKEIYESLEEAVDKCEDAFDIIEGIILKHA